MRRLCVVVLGTLLTALVARGDDYPPRVGNFRDRVVRVEVRRPGAAPEYGFGIIVGANAQQYFIATANHVLRSSAGLPSPEIRIAFRANGLEWVPATDTGRSRTGEDLAVIAARKPSDAPVGKGCLHPERRSWTGAQTWVIGRDDTWVVSARPGAVSGEPDTQHRLRVDILGINSGTSGAAVMGEQGLIGMVLEYSGLSEASILDARSIKRAFEDWGIPWSLATCDVWQTKTATGDERFAPCVGSNGGIFNTPTNCGENTATRRPVCVTIPAAAEVVGTKLYRKWDSDGAYGEVAPGQDCDWCKFATAPVITTSGAAKSVCWEFAQWSSHQTRDARVVVTYRVQVDE